MSSSPGARARLQRKPSAVPALTQKKCKNCTWIVANTFREPKARSTAVPKLGFFMYPTAENASGRLDSYAPDDFRYQISAREIKA